MRWSLAQEEPETVRDVNEMNDFLSLTYVFLAIIRIETKHESDLCCLPFRKTLGRAL